MAMVTLIDKPHHKVQVRDDIADQWEVCPYCNGDDVLWTRVGASMYGRWEIWEPYRACDCNGGIRRKLHATQ